MRTFQVVLFALGVLSLLAAIPFAGSIAGDILWRAGMATLLGDIVCIMLWPRRSQDT
jgi:hypothetical protein